MSDLYPPSQSRPGAAPSCRRTAIARASAPSPTPRNFRPLSVMMSATELCQSSLLMEILENKSCAANRLCRAPIGVDLNRKTPDLEGLPFGQATTFQVAAPSGGVATAQGDRTHSSPDQNAAARRQGGAA